MHDCALCCGFTNYSVLTLSLSYNKNEIIFINSYLYENVCNRPLSYGQKSSEITFAFYILLEIKPCRLGPRIRDVEAFWYETEIKIIYFVPLLCLIVFDRMVYPDPKFFIFKTKKQPHFFSEVRGCFLLMRYQKIKFIMFLPKNISFKNFDQNFSARGKWLHLLLS